MISRLFSSRRKAPAAPTATLPAGQRVYAVGDIHGRLDLLEDLLVQIDRDDAARGAAETQLIFLGDLVDRGPDSAQVVERLIQLDTSYPRTRFLLGNHEEVFLKAAGGDLKALAFFNKIGGRETILSYGVPEQAYLDASYPELLELWLMRLPPEHVTFLQRFEDMIVLGDYAFVHAGIRPEAPLDLQKPSDLRWIRNEFLEHRGAFEKVVVHGHTIFEQVEQTAHRIGLDTGAYASGRLTAMGFEAADRWILQTNP